MRKRFSVDLLLTISAVLSASNVAITALITVILIRVFRFSKTNITMGLLILSGFLLVENGLQVYSFLVMNVFFSSAIMPYVFFINLTEFAGMLMFLKIVLQ